MANNYNFTEVMLKGNKICRGMDDCAKCPIRPADEGKEGCNFAYIENLGKSDFNALAENIMEAFEEKYGEHPY